MNLHEYPDGWLDVLIEAVIRYDLNYSIEMLTEEDDLTNDLLKRSVGKINTSIKDHWGSNGNLVFEPYGNYDKPAKKFASYLGVELITGNDPEWDQKCHRYEFVVREATPVAKSFAELIRCTIWEFRQRCSANDSLRRLRSAISSVNAN